MSYIAIHSQWPFSVNMPSEQLGSSPREVNTNARLFVNSQLLRGIREPSDVVSMPEEKRALAIRAMRNAQHCLEICLRGENYRNGLRYAVHYTRECLNWRET